MEMVWHHDKLMQQIFSLRPIVQQDIDQQTSHPVGLENVSFLECRGSNEVATESGVAAAGSSHGRHLSGSSRLHSGTLSQR